VRYWHWGCCFIRTGNDCTRVVLRDAPTIVLVRRKGFVSLLVDALPNVSPVLPSTTHHPTMSAKFRAMFRLPQKWKLSHTLIDQINSLGSESMESRFEETHPTKRMHMNYYVHGRTIPGGIPILGIEPHETIEAALQESRARMSFGGATIWIVDHEGELVLDTDDVRRMLDTENSAETISRRPI